MEPPALGCLQAGAGRSEDCGKVAETFLYLFASFSTDWSSSSASSLNLPYVTSPLSRQQRPARPARLPAFDQTLNGASAVKLSPRETYPLGENLFDKLLPRRLPYRQGNRLKQLPTGFRGHSAAMAELCFFPCCTHTASVSLLLLLLL